MREVVAQIGKKETMKPMASQDRVLIGYGGRMRPYALPPGGTVHLFTFRARDLRSDSRCNSQPTDYARVTLQSDRQKLGTVPG